MVGTSVFKVKSQKAALKEVNTGVTLAIAYKLNLTTGCLTYFTDSPTYHMITQESRLDSKLH